MTSDDQKVIDAVETMAIAIRVLLMVGCGLESIREYFNMTLELERIRENERQQ